jgi:hypothetical protein
MSRQGCRRNEQTKRGSRLANEKRPPRKANPKDDLLKVINPAEKGRSMLRPYKIKRPRWTGAHFFTKIIYKSRDRVVNRNL